MTAMRAAFSSTIALFRANAAVRALIARFVDGAGVAAGGVVDDGDGVAAEQGVGPARRFLRWWLR